MPLPRSLRQVVLPFFAIAAIAVFLIPHAAAQQSATVGVGDTTLVFSGHTSPSAFVSIFRNSSLIGTLVAAGDGSFSATFPAQPPGVARLNVVSRDAQGILTDNAELEVTLQDHLQTNVYVFLPTTLRIASSALTGSQQLRLSGMTIPSGNVYLFVDGQPYGTAIASSAGEWQFSGGIQPLQDGLHGVFARVHDADGDQSFATRTQSFTVTRPIQRETPAVNTPVPSPRRNVPSAPRFVSPTERQRLATARVLITGQGMPGSQIEIYEGRDSLGSAYVSSSGVWSLPYTFRPGMHTLQGRACLNGNCSPFGDSVTFEVLDSASGIMKLRAYLDKSAQNLRISGRDAKSREVSVRLRIPEGTPPFSVTVDWGDAKKDRSRYDSRIVDLRHRYDRTGQYSGRILIRNPAGSQELLFTVNLVADNGPAASRNIIIAALLLLLALGMVLGYRYYFRRSSSGSVPGR